MCSFIGTNREVVETDLEKANQFTKNRGPDKTSVSGHEGITFVHNLLSITGDFKEQPLWSTDGSTMCLFNGEIYNYSSFGDYQTDGDCLIPLYETMGEAFVEKLDGEYAIVIIDFLKDRIVFATDPFATKPLWWCIEGAEFAFASYESAIKNLGFSTATKVPPNKVVCRKLSDMTVITSREVFKFDIKQHKQHYEDWCDAFISSLSKRVGGLREKAFIGLSGGYDSGAIAAGLDHLNLPYRAYTIPGAENVEILAQRHGVVPDMHILNISPEQFYFEKDFLRQECEDFHFNGKPAARTDKASAGLSLICRTARTEGYKVYLSGQGADEIISDYGFNGRGFYTHSQFGGRFPEDLTRIFPWRSFYGGTQEKYLGKEECVAGSHGIETRYPFLDKALVQEFLWLDSSLKNRFYKAPLHHFLSKYDFPFSVNEKVGFRPNHKFK